MRGSGRGEGYGGALGVMPVKVRICRSPAAERGQYGLLDIYALYGGVGAVFNDNIWRGFCEISSGGH